MTVRDENVERCREVREKLVQQYGGLAGWFRHLQAKCRKRESERSALSRRGKAATAKSRVRRAS